MAIRGYKAFDKNMDNRYGRHFEEGKTYRVDGDVAFGLNGNGFHFCKRCEDTLRYFDGMNEDIVMAEVIGSGNIVESFDEYYGYYDMFSAEQLEIIRFIPRSELVMNFLNMKNIERVKRFIQGYRLRDIEKAMFRSYFSNEESVLKTIDYYQDGDLEAFNHDKTKVYRRSGRSLSGGNK